MHFDAPQDLEIKLNDFNPEKNNKLINKQLEKKFVDWWIGELMSGTRTAALWTKEAKYENPVYALTIFIMVSDLFLINCLIGILIYIYCAVDLVILYTYYCTINYIAYFLST